MFVKRNFVREFKASASFQKKDYKKALEEIFLRMDDMMVAARGKTASPT